MQRDCEIRSWRVGGKGGVGSRTIPLTMVEISSKGDRPAMLAGKDPVAQKAMVSPKLYTSAW